MKRALIVLALAGGFSTGRAAAQTIPDGSAASKVQLSYRRTPTFRFDPFRHVAIPHWGLVFGTGASAVNNALNAEDFGAILYLAGIRTGIPPKKVDNADSLTIGDAVDAIGLIPRGLGLNGSAQAQGGAYLGGPFGSHVSLGFSAGGSGYGAFQLDDQVVSLLRDGNGGRTSFSFGSSQAGGLATAEGGAHAILRFGPVGSVDGVKVNLGFGGRYLRPIAYAHAGSTIPNGGSIMITGDSISADIAIEQLFTTDPSASLKGSGKAADFLVRFEWPTSGLALEAEIANIGSVTVPGVERSTAQFKVKSTNLQEVNDSLDNADFKVRDTISVNVTLPRVVRFTASSWANRILQIDLSTTMPVTGEFESPLAVDIGTTWRFIRTLPLRAGVVLGGNQGIGYTGGFAIEGRNMFLQIAGQSLGGFLRKATGVGVRLELGLFF
ncbi:MAG: hypothetical protein HY700_13720 [Gemmatimonadetes bacterium]|nr:hypothetical protein [Gemmatimonadota bacterium]